MKQEDRREQAWPALRFAGAAPTIKGQERKVAEILNFGKGERQ